MSGAYYKQATVLADGSSAEFFFIDTTPILRHHSSWTGSLSMNDQIAWLGSELPRSTARWKIVVGHHPAYSGEPGKGSRALIDWLVRSWNVRGCNCTSTVTATALSTLSFAGCTI
jgi:hypothetical protein